MKELSLFQIIKYAFKALINSEVLVLLVLELAVLLLSYAFSKIINKKFVKNVAIIASVIIMIFYGLNYIDTLSLFMDNVSTKLMEFIYFPSTLEFLGIMLTSFVIMVITLSRKKEKKVIKIINIVVPVIISFLFFSIIEYMNGADIEFNEFSVFTEPVLMSLNELAIGLFVAWLISLLIYKVDILVIKKTNAKKIVEKNVLDVEEISINEKQQTNTLISVNLDKLPKLKEEEIELPRLKSQI